MRRRYYLLDRPPKAQGRLTRMVGLTLEAVGLSVAVGRQCQVVLKDDRIIDAEVVGFNGDITYLMPVQKVEGLQPGSKVIPQDERQTMAIGDHLKGRILNGIGKPLDGKGELPTDASISLRPSTINPLARSPIKTPLDVGVRAINGLLTVGKGQRIGLFAGSGVGKSVLLGMMTRFTNADVVVVGLIGERGREVKEFVDEILGTHGLSRAVVVASPADDAPLMRLRAAELCTRIAEYFRDQGKNCLLLMDSLTRYAQAQREISLAVGEPPATKGYPPSVFSKIPELVERAGNADKGGGSITAFYTVLTEGDDLQDPIADSARAILDGHIVLKREIAEEGIYPAIDVSASVSRVMPAVVSAEQLQKSLTFKSLLSRYRSNKDLIAIGAYKPGSDPHIDEAVERFPALNAYVSQTMTEASPLIESIKKLDETLGVQPSSVEPAGALTGGALGKTSKTNNGPLGRKSGPLRSQAKGAANTSARPVNPSNPQG